MADNNDDSSSIFKKALEAGGAWLEAQIAKSENVIKAQSTDGGESGFNFGKAVTRDRNYHIGAQGWQERPGAIGYEFQKHMFIKSSIISAIVKTRQNKVAAFSSLEDSHTKKGWNIFLKDDQCRDS